MDFSKTRRLTEIRLFWFFFINLHADLLTCCSTGFIVKEPNRPCKGPVHPKCQLLTKSERQNCLCADLKDCVWGERDRCVQVSSQQQEVSRSNLTAHWTRSAASMHQSGYNDVTVKLTFEILNVVTSSFYFVWTVEWCHRDRSQTWPSLKTTWVRFLLTESMTTLYFLFTSTKASWEAFQSYGSRWTDPLWHTESGTWYRVSSVVTPTSCSWRLLHLSTRTW